MLSRADAGQPNIAQLVTMTCSMGLSVPRFRDLLRSNRWVRFLTASESPRCPQPVPARESPRRAREVARNRPRTAPFPPPKCPRPRAFQPGVDGASRPWRCLHGRFLPSCRGHSPLALCRAGTLNLPMSPGRPQGVPAIDGAESRARDRPNWGLDGDSAPG